MLSVRCWLAGLLVLVSGVARAAEFTLTVEPTYPADQAQAVYRPLLDYLQRTTGHNFKLHVPSSFHQYWQELRAGRQTDFAFEEAHFADYRRLTRGFVPVVRTEEDAQYAVVVSDAGLAAQGPSAVVGRVVAGLGAPSLGYVLLYDGFRNPLQQPELRAMGSKWSDGPDLIFSGDVDGAVMPIYLAQENPALSVVWRSRTVPGRLMAANPAISSSVRNAIRDAMLKLHEDSTAFSVTNELRFTRLIPTDGAPYEGMEKLLASTFGYVAPVRRQRAAPPTAEDASGGTVRIGDSPGAR